MSQISAQLFVKAINELEQSDWVPYSYSGRGMYGRRCIAVNFEKDGELPEFALRLAYSLYYEGSLHIAEMLTDLASIFKGTKVDSMGRGIVAYWPDLDWPGARVTSTSHPHIHKAFELISHDRGTQAGHASYEVPPRWTGKLDQFEHSLAQLTEEDLTTLCIGEQDACMAVTEAADIPETDKFLNEFFNEWEEDKG